MTAASRAAFPVSQQLAQLLDGTLSASEHGVLVHGAVRQAERFLQLIIRRKSYRMDGIGLSLRDIACDMLGELLAEDDHGPCAELRDSLLRAADRNGSPADPAALESLYLAILYRTVQQNLPRFFAEHDPLRASLLRSIRLHAGKHPAIAVVLAVNGRWYHMQDVDPLFRLPAASWEELLLLMMENGHAGESVGATMRHLLAALSRQSERRRALNEHDLLQLFAENIMVRFRQERPAATADPDDGPDGHLAALIGQAVDRSAPWIEHSFVRTGKITPSEAEAFRDAARAYLMDATFGDHLGLYQYLKRFLPGLSHPVWRDRYRNRFEYFLRQIFTILGETVVNI